MLKLYWASGTCALASHIALEEVGAKYETARLDFTQGDQRKPDRDQQREQPEQVPSLAPAADPDPLCDQPEDLGSLAAAGVDADPARDQGHPRPPGSVDQHRHTGQGERPEDEEVPACGAQLEAAVQRIAPLVPLLQSEALGE